MAKATAPTDNLRLWNQVQATDPAFTKPISGKGFKGTAINPTYIARRLTELFGPCGMGWRFEIEDEKYVPGHKLPSGDTAVLHVVRGHLEYREPGSSVWFRTGPQYGQTMLVGSNSHGVYTDEEAPKKSITDATTKCAVMLGVSADIFSGAWDSNKYVNTPASAPSGAMPVPAVPPPVAPALPTAPNMAAPAPQAAATPATPTTAVKRLPKGYKSFTPEQWANYLPTRTLDGKRLADALAAAVAHRGTVPPAAWEKLCGVFAANARALPDGPEKHGVVGMLTAERDYLDSQVPQQQAA